LSPARASFTASDDATAGRPSPPTRPSVEEVDDVVAAVGDDGGDDTGRARDAVASSEAGAGSRAGAAIDDDAGSVVDVAGRIRGADDSGAGGSGVGGALARITCRPVLRARSVVDETSAAGTGGVARPSGRGSDDDEGSAEAGTRGRGIDDDEDCSAEAGTRGRGSDDEDCSAEAGKRGRGVDDDDGSCAVDVAPGTAVMRVRMTSRRTLVASSGGPSPEFLRSATTSTSP
jgi:hypothetical protein